MYKPIKMLHNNERVEQITIYDIDSEKSVHISDEYKIKTYVNELKNLKIKKRKPVGNSSATGLMLHFRDGNGDTIDTLYTSEKELIYHHWLVNIIDGENPYEKIILEFNK